MSVRLTWLTVMRMPHASTRMVASCVSVVVVIEGMELIVLVSEIHRLLFHEHSFFSLSHSPVYSLSNLHQM